MQSDNATLDFGAFPGSSHATLVVSSNRTQGIPPNAEVRVSVQPRASADHTADEHVVESIRFVARRESESSIRIDAFNTNDKVTAAGKGTFLVGQFNCRWEWLA